VTSERSVCEMWADSAALATKPQMVHAVSGTNRASTGWMASACLSSGLPRIPVVATDFVKATAAARRLRLG
jgi:hypothetical protein